MIVRLAASALILVFGVAGWVSFHPLAGVWLVLLAGLVYRDRAVGLAVFFVVLPLDLARPLPGGIFVSYSELELAVCVLALLAGGAALRDLDWRPLLWWSPFLAAVLTSAFINTEWYKAVPHLLRNAELGVVALLALNVYRRHEAGFWLDLALAGAVGLQLGLAFEQLLDGGSVRLTGSLSNPNQFGGLLGLTAVVSFSRLSVLWQEARGNSAWSKPKRVHYLRWPSSLGGLCGTILASSRSAILSTVLGILVAAGLSRSTAFGGRTRGWPIRTWAMYLAIVAVGGLMFTQAALLRPVTDDLVKRTREGLHDSVQLRLAIFKVAAGIWLTQPLAGVGPGRWEEAVVSHVEHMDEAAAPFVRAVKEGSDRPAVLRHAHNLPLQIAALYGVLGLAGLAFAAAGWWCGFLKCGGPASAAGLTLMAAFAVNNMADSLFPSLAMETGWLLGALLAAALAQADVSPLSSQN